MVEILVLTIKKLTKTFRKTSFFLFSSLFIIAQNNGLIIKCSTAEELPIAYLEYATNKIQQGYDPEVFTHIDLRLHNRVEARNQAEQIVSGSYSAYFEADEVTHFLNMLHKYNCDTARAEILRLGQQNEKVASVMGEFIYLPNTDGKITYFTDGLATTILKERVVDEYGNVQLRNTYNMKYNDDRLLTSYDSETTDNLGNKTYISRYDIVYTPDSVFYATHETNAVKNILSYREKIIDSSLQTTEILWQAHKYEWHFLKAFTIWQIQQIDDKKSFSWYNRLNIEYRDPLHPTSYDEIGERPHLLRNGENLGTMLKANYVAHIEDILYNQRDQIEHSKETRWDAHSSLGTVPLTFQEWFDEEQGKAFSDKCVKTVSIIDNTYKDAPHLFGKDVDPDPARIIKTSQNISTYSPDGSHSNQIKTVEFIYDERFKLLDAEGNLIGQGHNQDYKDYWYEVPGKGTVALLSEQAGCDKNGKPIWRFFFYNGNMQKTYVDVTKEPAIIKTLTAEGIKYQYRDANGNLFEIAVELDEGGKPFFIITQTHEKISTPSLTIEDGKSGWYEQEGSLEFIILDGKPMIEKENVVTKQYDKYATSINEKITGNIVSQNETANWYKYELVDKSDGERLNKNYKLINSKKIETNWEPSIDPERKYATIRTINTSYQYNNNLNILGDSNDPDAWADGITSTGSIEGWNTSMTSTGNNFFGHYRRNIKENYIVQDGTGLPLRIEYIEDEHKELP
ncbi:MAG: hypothetical protein N2606_03780 [Candidatus Omnitrophica bacterium]|nr:hypothetical protein [Candidatus Omnitrophota bacterium]